MHNIDYTLKKYKRSKSIRLTITKSGDVQITAPSYVSKKYIDTFIFEKREWITQKLNTIPAHPQKSKEQKRKEYLTHKEDAYKRIEEQVKKINSFYNFSYNKIFIKNQKTRWGSCSSNKNLNFNYKIIFLPEHLSAYIITHELCHLKEMNHGKKFWKLIELSIPNYKSCHIELKHITSKILS